MKRPLHGGAPPSGAGAGFTLIELLAVMAIILVLAGLILNIAGSAQYNSARSRATSEIKAMETALENYKSDNGAYPSDPNSSETLDAQNTSMYHDPTATIYLKSSEFLYQALAGFTPTSAGASTFTQGKVYIAFKPDQLHVASDAGTVTTASNTSPFMYISDPFGYSYGYSTIYAATAAANAAQSPPSTTPITKGYNPTFDLWSTAGYASGGKSTPANMPGTDAANYSTLWVKNW